MDSQKVDPEVLKKLPKVGPESVPMNKDGSIAWDKLPTKWFLLGLGAIFLFGGGIFFLILAKFDLLAEYNGVAIQPATRICRPYHYHAFIHNTRDPFPVAPGWNVYADIASTNDYGERVVLISKVPYGEGECTDDTAKVCCQERLHLQWSQDPLGN